jgi:predicted PurR-regulated permease PerM
MSGWDVFWDILWFFFLVIWIMILFSVIMDLFRDHTESGVKKFIWCIFLIFLPFITVFVYVIVRGQGMAQRNMQRQVQAKQEFDSYVQDVSSSGGSAADQIAKAKGLLDSGAITQAEYDSIKTKALA